ncbi:hypothetical protein D9757_008678 [Collybiopsis confluens]|uniref:Uncharacterized protein n=1 Tax=Collybiopsis confluens TaxID=2823264 RepID=A0A8H5H466_9AGAR|nr:hypothetical protein D9757_008678 [Collybiopsis confluens]
MAIMASSALSSTQSTSHVKITEGTEILCFAAIIPALAVIMYICSRIINGGTKRARAQGHSNVNGIFTEKISSSSSTGADMPNYPNSTYLKKGSRLHTLDRYGAGPPSSHSDPASASSSSPYRPFANHRCSISLKSPSIPAAHSGFRPLSLFLSINKEQIKAKFAGRGKNHTAIPDLTQTLGGFSQADKQAMLHTWVLADDIVGAHPQAQPLTTRSTSSIGHVIRSSDFRLVSDSGSEIGWYTSNRKVAVVVPSVLRWPYVKNGKASKVKHENSQSKSLVRSAPSRIPVSKTLSAFTHLRYSDHHSEASLTGPSPTGAVHTLPDSQSEASSDPSSPLSVQSDFPALLSIKSTEFFPSPAVEVTHTNLTDTLSDPAISLNRISDDRAASSIRHPSSSRTKPLKIAQEDRVPELVTVVQPPLLPTRLKFFASSDKLSDSGARFERRSNMGDSRVNGRVRVLNTLTNLTQSNSSSELAYLAGGTTAASPDSVPSFKTTNTRGKSGRYRDFGRGRKLVPDGKENVRPEAIAGIRVGPAF